MLLLLSEESDFERIKIKFYSILYAMSMNFTRSLMETIRWNAKLIIIKGD
jgi:hypothetical protein